jgi:predicted RNase H-like HicB family nuclease
MDAMSPKKTYVAVYERDPDDDAWLVSIKGIEGCQTYGRSLRQAETRIREALALWLDRDPDGIAITNEFPKRLESLASTVIQARNDAEHAGTKAQQTTVDVVRQLTDLGLSRRDAAELLGISHQRVQQLLAS